MMNKNQTYKNAVKFSVIVPCYNSFKKMDRCLDSLENQTNKDFEVIFIDDSSTDDSLFKLKSYSKQSKMPINIIQNNNNEGPGFSRNLGINHAKGKYLLFLDADDALSYDTIAIADNILNRDSSIDCIIFDYLKCSDNKKTIFSILPNAENGYIDTSFAFKFIRGCTCGKIYKKKTIIDNNVVFSRAVRNEDMPFTKVAISFCNNIYYYKEKPLYYYIMYNTSLMHNKNLLDENNAFNSFNIVKRYSNKKLKACLEILFIKECLYSMLQTMILKKYRKKTIKKRLCEISCDYSTWYLNQDIKYLDKGKKTVLFFYKYSMFLPIKIIFFIKERVYD